MAPEGYPFGRFLCIPPSCSEDEENESKFNYPMQILYGTWDHICTEVHNWMYNVNYKPKAIKRRLTKQITSVPLRHLVWNITARFMNPKLYSGDNKAIFIKTLFPKEFADTEIDTIKNFKVDARKSEIPIDEPEVDNFSFHYPEDYLSKR